ncbi:unnamed protein product [Dovyalis caffra]|uniref:Fe2OG dioxygenase domain-containing protein n=1 Tax=Dovyalis caffra TaxID=77055 RepID=A0AAV1RQD3_9ROSI|nr:unnamed protein product [Dovyalis caffra]
MGEVDRAFIQAQEHRPKPKIIEAEGIPLIDLSITSTPNTNLNDPHALDGLVEEIGNACRNWGFFQVINHGVPLAKRQNIEKVSRESFGQPLEEKNKIRRNEEQVLGYYDTEHTKNVRDWKEVFDFNVQDPTIVPASYKPDDKELTKWFNQWPENPPNLRDICEEYAKEMEKLAFKLMELIALSLGLPKDRFLEFFKEQTSTIRFNHYPPCPIPDLALGVGRHKDAVALTLLAQDDVGGLEVKRKTDGEWLRVKPNPNAYIINVGDIIQVWSNDTYESVEHRAMVNSDRERFSIPYFLAPAHSTDVQPLEELINEQNPAKYKPYNWGKFFVTRRRSNFQKLDVENIQIYHFKIPESELAEKLAGASSIGKCILLVDHNWMTAEIVESKKLFKKMVMTNEIDWISQLPDHIIHHILSFQPGKNVARISVLSKTWHGFWTSFPVSNLQFSERLFERGLKRPCAIGEIKDWKTKFARLVHDSVLRQCRLNTSIEKFELSMSYYLHPDIPPRIDHSLEMIIDRGVKEVHVKFKENSDLPPSIFSAKRLTVLKLARCNLIMPCPSVIWPSLRKFSLPISISNKRLEKLLFSWNILSQATIHARRLKSLKYNFMGYPFRIWWTEQHDWKDIRIEHCKGNGVRETLTCAALLKSLQLLSPRVGNSIDYKCESEDPCKTDADCFILCPSKYGFCNTDNELPENVPKTSEIDESQVGYFGFGGFYAPNDDEHIPSQRVERLGSNKALLRKPGRGFVLFGPSSRPNDLLGAQDKLTSIQEQESGGEMFELVPELTPVVTAT